VSFSALPRSVTRLALHVSTAILRGSKHDCRHREGSAGVPHRATVLAEQRWLRVLGCTAVLLGALGGAVFVPTARADDLAPPASIEAAPSSASAATDSPPAAAPPVTAAAPGASDSATDSSDTSGTAADANVPTADAAGASSTTTGAAVPAADADTSANAADASDSATDSSDTSGTTSTDTDATAPGTAPEAAGCTSAAAPSGTTSTGTDATAPGTAPEAGGCTSAAAPSGTTSTGTAPEAAGCTSAADTSSATSGAVPAAASGDSIAQACANDNQHAGRRSGSDAVNGGTDSVSPPSGPAPADDGSSAGSSTSSSARPEVPSDLTTIDSLPGESSLDESTPDSGLGGPTTSGADTTGSGTTLMHAFALTLKADVVGMIRPQVDYRVVVWESAVSACARSDSERILLARSPTHVDMTQAARSGVRTGENRGHLNGSRKAGSPVPRAPDNDKPRMPPAPSSLLRSGDFGGMQGKGVNGVLTARFSLIPPRDGRLVTLVEKRWRALRLFFILERPG
jgi:hypothetical protein